MSELEQARMVNRVTHQPGDPAIQVQTQAKGNLFSL